MKSLFSRCDECDNGWIRQPDGYGCVEWTLCALCGGTGKIEEAGYDRGGGWHDGGADEAGPMPKLQDYP